MNTVRDGFVSSGEARLYYQTAGAGIDLVFLHAGVADSRQWSTAFSHFANTHRVHCYDMRGFGRSQPVAGSFRAIDDLTAVLGALEITRPAVFVGCSMGGTLAMDFTLAHPERVSGLVMVCSGPSGLKLDVPEPIKFAAVEKAEQAGDLDLVCELETQIWFDGESRSPDEVDSAQRSLLYQMNRTALEHDSLGLGERQRDLTPAAHQRLNEIEAPVLVVVGELDLAYTQAAADHMCANLRRAQRVNLSGAAHLPNMEQPQRFNAAVEEFVAEQIPAA